jgi:hypothetical protein
MVSQSETDGRSIVPPSFDLSIACPFDALPPVAARRVREFRGGRRQRARARGAAVRTKTARLEAQQFFHDDVTVVARNDLMVSNEARSSRDRAATVFNVSRAK